MTLLFGHSRRCDSCHGKGKRSNGTTCGSCGGTGVYTPPTPALDFDGPTYIPIRTDEPGSDRERLNKQLIAVKGALSDGDWYTLAELAAIAGCETQSASARLRDLRKKRFGGYTIDKEYVSHGLWKYRLVSAPAPQTT